LFDALLDCLKLFFKTFKNLLTGRLWGVCWGCMRWSFWGGFLVRGGLFLGLWFDLVSFLMRQFGLIQLICFFLLFLFYLFCLFCLFCLLR
jgi:hypothetical protein